MRFVPVIISRLATAFSWHKPHDDTREMVLMSLSGSAIVLTRFRLAENKV